LFTLATEAVPIASLNPRVLSVRCIGSNLLVKRQEDAEKVGALFMPDNQKHVGLAKFDVIAVSPKVAQEYGIKPGDVVYAPRQLGFQRVELPEGLCNFIPIQSVQAHEPA
jgi:hypothetical protein